MVWTRKRDLSVNSRSIFKTCVILDGALSLFYSVHEKKLQFEIPWSIKTRLFHFIKIKDFLGSFLYRDFQRIDLDMDRRLRKGVGVALVIFQKIIT